MVYTNSSRKGRANYSREFKQRLVDAANQPGVSVSKLAQEHGGNANLLFKWRRDAKAEAPALYSIELVLPPASTKLFLPPTPQPETLTPETAYEPTPSGTIEIRLGRAMIVIDGTVDTNHYECSWRPYAYDQSSYWHPDMDRGRYHRHEKRLQWGSLERALLNKRISPQFQSLKSAELSVHHHSRDTGVRLPSATFRLVSLSASGKFFYSTTPRSTRNWDRVLNNGLI